MICFQMRLKPHGLKIALLVFMALITFSGCFPFPEKELRRKMEKVGGVEAVRSACARLHEQLRNGQVLSEMPEDGVLNRLEPQVVEILSSENVRYYNIQMTGGFLHTGYVITVDGSQYPSEDSFPFSNWRKYELQPGAWIYVE